MNLLRRYIRQLIIESIERQPAENVFVGEKFIPVNISNALKVASNHQLREHVYNILRTSGQLSIYPTIESLENHHLNAFYAYDVTGDGIPNVIFAGWVSLRSSYGKIKLVMSGTDGTPEAINFYKKEFVRLINSGEAIAEVSGAPAAILMKAGVEALSEDKVQTMFRKPTKTWNGKHPIPASRDARNAKKYGPSGKYNKWYSRKLKGGKTIVKLMFARL